MDPETQRLFVISLVGLLLFFPVFNQVAATALETLRDADHKAQFDDFFKNWEDIPDDRKLEYWDGRNPPPEHWEGGEPPDDFTYGGNGQGRNGQNGQNGNGEGNESEEEEEEEEERFVYETQVLWKFPGNRSLGTSSQDRESLPQRDYHWVNVTYIYEGFSGYAEFTLFVGEQEEWGFQVGDDTAPAVFENQPLDNEDIQDVGTVPLVIEHDYDPIGFPQGDFNVTIKGTYPVSRG